MRPRTAVLLILIFSGELVFQRAADAQTKLSQSVLGNGGAVIGNNSFRLLGTMGQAGIGVTSNSSHAYKAGFWYLPKGVITRVEQPENNVPTEYQLRQNYPNPFNPATMIEFALPHSGHVTLKVFNSTGEEIVTLVDQELTAGNYKVNWEAKGLASGVYFYRLQTENFAQTMKLVLMR